ncbi:MAG TPA: C39 family peptidase [Anaerolineaceae bacterium]|nr:C39 family peptidase [Anaerolineaceae bacterium]
MKIKTLVIWGIFLVLLFGVTTSRVLAQSDMPSTNFSCASDADRLNVVNQHIQLQGNVGAMPEWDGAEAGQSTSYYDLDGAIAVYMYPVMNLGREVGYVILEPGSCQIIEFSAGIQPHHFSQGQAQEIASQWDTQLNPNQYIYLGPTEYFYVMQPLGSNSDHRILLHMLYLDYLVVNQDNQFIDDQSVFNFPAPDIDLSLFPKLQPNKANIGQTLLGTYKELVVPDQEQFWYGSCYVGCTPTAGGVIMGYWVNHGYPNLDDPSLPDAIRRLNQLAGTFCSGNAGVTYYENLAPAMDSYTAEKGYSDFGSSTEYSAGVTFEAFKNEIDHDRPLAAHFTYESSSYPYSPVHGHSNTGVGYNTNGGNYIMIKTNATSFGWPYTQLVLFNGGGPYPGYLMYSYLLPPDNPAPVTTHTISGTLGQDGWYVTKPTITLSSTDNFGGSGVSYIQYRVDGGGWITYNAGFTIYNGQHTIDYRAVDNAGHWETAKSFSIKVDTVKPINPNTISPGCTAQSGIWQNTCNDANFTWSGASDEHSGVAGYEYLWANGTAAWTTSSGYNPPIVSDGSYMLQIRTKDNAGNWSSWVTRFILKYDGTTPTGSLNLNHGASLTYVTLVRAYLSSSDASSGVVGYRMRETGGNWTEWKASAGSVLWLLPPVSNSQHIIEVQYKDQAGNLSNIASVDIWMDLYPVSPSSTNYTLARSTFGVTGTTGSTSNYQLNGTLGQPSMIGLSTSTHYRVCAGYWAENCTTEPKIYLPVILR